MATDIAATRIPCRPFEFVAPDKARIESGERASAVSSAVRR
jgi:hypothetical protein